MPTKSSLLEVLITPLRRASMRAEPLSTLIVSECVPKSRGLSKVTMASALLAERVRIEFIPIVLS